MTSTCIINRFLLPVRSPTAARGSNKDKSKSVFELMADDLTLMTRALNMHKLSVDLYKYALAHACMQYYYFKEQPSAI